MPVMQIDESKYRNWVQVGEEGSGSAPASKFNISTALIYGGGAAALYFASKKDNKNAILFAAAAGIAYYMKSKGRL